MKKRTAVIDALSAHLVTFLRIHGEPTPTEVLKSNLALVEPLADFEYALLLVKTGGWAYEPEPGILAIPRLLHGRSTPKPRRHGKRIRPKARASRSG